LFHRILWENILEYPPGIYDLHAIATTAQHDILLFVICLHYSYLSPVKAFQRS